MKPDLVVERDLEPRRGRPEVGRAQRAEPPGGVEQHRVERGAEGEDAGHDPLVVDDRQLRRGLGRRLVDTAEQQPVLVDEVAVGPDLPDQQPTRSATSTRTSSGKRDA